MMVGENLNQIPLIDTPNWAARLSNLLSTCVSDELDKLTLKYPKDR
jgi:hypothetical protein